MRYYTKWRGLTVLLLTLITGCCLGYLWAESGRQKALPSKIPSLPRGGNLFGAKTTTIPMAANDRTNTVTVDDVIKAADTVVLTQHTSNTFVTKHEDIKAVLNINEDINIYDTGIVRNSTSTLLNNKCVLLRIPDSQLTTPICVYERSADVYISGSLLTSGTWEKDIMKRIRHALDEHPRTVFLDLGCNIGVFTLMAAKLGHRVVSVDPLRKNLFLLSRSLEQGNLTANVTLLNNAVGDKVERITLHEHEGNVGGTFVKPASQSNVVDEDHIATAVTLDHMIPLLANQTVVMKIDVETYEWDALKCGYNFFKNVNVTCIFMEWASHKNTPVTASGIISFMRRFSFVPHVNNNQLSFETNTTWPNDILWIKSHTR